MEEIGFDWHKSLPDYLLDSEKDRLSRALNQFQQKRDSGKREEIDYSNFYLSDFQILHLLQGDLIHSIPRPYWNSEDKAFENSFSPGLLVSNSCDVSGGNIRQIKKDAVFAPLIPLFEYENDMRNGGLTQNKIDSILSQIKRQTYSNIFYLPPIDKGGKGFLAFLDQLFSIPAEELEQQQANTKSNRLISLDNFGSYLFIVKLSFHFCRIPEEVERRPA